VLNGGAGNEDKLDYAGRTAPLTITLCVDSAAATGVGTCGNPRNDGEAGEADAVLNTEVVLGGSGNDSITGASADEWIYGNGGDDVISGAGGNDHLDGGPGSNTLTGDAGADICQNYVQATACDLHVYTCNAGTKRDCDRAPENACETDIQTSAQHCGACGAACAAGQGCSGGSCVWTVTTAAFSGPGLSDCGSSGTESCAASPLVTGGTFFRGTTTAYPATVSDFRLDKYEVTVGRFRKFVDAWIAGWRPSAGAGKHAHLNAGAGLANTAGGNEPGWDASWSASVGATVGGGVSPTSKADWDANLTSCGSWATWTSAVGANERRPIDCVLWYDLAAFCIWDGGFLPSETEWEYAAAGGSEERTYPWGNSAPTANEASYFSSATNTCTGDGVGGCNVDDMTFVGSKSAGAGRWGHVDLAGNTWEWTLDKYQGYAASCVNCVNLGSNSDRSIRGGSAGLDETSLPAAQRYGNPQGSRGSTYGGRCARSP
jgi:formylglycine-generating enzyme required for sulfatase activity